ncbi:MAG: hypothetical protein H6R17_1622 [Proteobacteria bacterium]|nr:hypothetical protein [Pseudomonadota bacterium]
MPESKPRFDLTDPIVVIRILCGLLFVPHILFKLNGMDGAAAFFAKAGFSPAMPIVVLALIAETTAAIGLVFGILTKWSGLLSAAVLAGATQAVLSTKGAVWLWNLGGIEYNVFWCALSLILAANAWRDERRQFGRSFLLSPKLA